MPKKSEAKGKKKYSAKELTKMCIECKGKCCRYFSLEIDTPDCKKEYEEIRWYLCHTNTQVFIDEEKWYLLVNNKCKHLGKDNLCKSYDDRPEICREHEQDDCEIDDSIFYDEIFKNEKDFRKYLKDNGEKYW